MIDIENVNDILKSVGDYSDDQLKKYRKVVDNAVSVINSMTESQGSNSKIDYLCALKANYDIVLLSASEDNITSFTAGDVSITQGTDLIAFAKQLYTNALNDCADLIKDNGFAFLGV